eukprot:gene16887-biopygen10191
MSRTARERAAARLQEEWFAISGRDAALRARAAAAERSRVARAAAAPVLSNPATSTCGDGRSMEGVWEKCGRSVEEVWKKCGRSMEGVWKKCGRSMEGVWKKCGRSMEEVWQKYGRSMEEVWNCTGLQGAARRRRAQFPDGGEPNSQTEAGPIPSVEGVWKECGRSVNGTQWGRYHGGDRRGRRARAAGGARATRRRAARRGRREDVYSGPSTPANRPNRLIVSGRVNCLRRVPPHPHPSESR